MSDNEPNEVAPKILAWADRLRDLAATGLHYSEDPYDIERFETIQQISLEMMKLAASANGNELEPLELRVFSRMTPYAVGSGAVIDGRGRILLLQRPEKEHWSLPGGGMEVGETPAAGVLREIREETGYFCEAVALIGVYDSRIWHPARQLQSYSVCLLCKPDSGETPSEPKHAHESLGIDWFEEGAVPEEMHPGHRKRVQHAYEFWHGERQLAHFDNSLDA